MEAKAILLFTEFTLLTQLYRCTDGEYFVELDDAEAYIANNLLNGGYSIVYRVDPLPVIPSPNPASPIWVYVPNPEIENGLRYDGVISTSADQIGTLGIVAHTTNNVGAFKINQYVHVSARLGAFGYKYGKIIDVQNNILYINFLRYEGLSVYLGADWDVTLAGKDGVQGFIGQKGDPGEGRTQFLTRAGIPTLGDGQEMAEKDIILNTVNGDLWKREIFGLLANDNFLNYPGNIWFQKIGNLRGPSSEIRGVNVVDTSLSIAPEWVNRTIFIDDQQACDTITLNELSVLDKVIIDNISTGFIDLTRGTFTIKIYPNEKVYVEILAANWFKINVFESLKTPHFGLIYAPSLSISELDYHSRSKVKYMMVSGGPKTVLLSANLELGKEVEIINGSASGDVTITLPAGHTWNGMLGGGNPVVVDRGNSIDSSPSTIPIKATIFRISLTSWLAY